MNNVSSEYGKVTLYTKTNHESTKTIDVIKLPSAFGFLKSPFKDSLFYKILTKKTDICITNEFNFWSFLVVFICFFSTHCKSIVLVENNPKFLKGYGVDKTNIVNKYWRRIIASFSNVLVTNNTFGEEYLLYTLLVNKNKIITSPYLVSNIPPKNLKFKEEKDIIKFLFVGQLNTRKGVEQLVLAVNFVNKEFSDNAELHIIGRGDLEDKLKSSLCKEVIGSIYFHGFVPYTEIYKYYHQCDVFIWPTLADFRALVGFEAISAGLPLIFSKYDGAYDEVVIENENGFIIDPTNYEEIAEKIKWFIKNKSSIEKMSETSIEISKLYSLTISKSTLLKAIELCI